MERRRMRRKPAFGKRIMVTMLSLVMLLSMLSPGLLAGADETTTDPTVQQTPETPNDQAPGTNGQTQPTDTAPTETEGNFLDSFMDAYDQQTQNGGEQLGSLALSYIAKYDLLKGRIQALDPAAEDYAAQVEALNAEIAALDAAVAASAANGELTEAEVASVRAAAVGSVTAPAPDGSSDEAGLKQQTVTAYVNNMTFAVSGKMPEGVSLSVTPVDTTVNDYIHNNILGLGALPAGYTGEAFDIKLLDKDGIEFQPTEQVNVGVTADGITEDSDVSVYHLPGTCADDVYAGYQRDVAGIALMARLMTQLIGEKVETVNVYDGYYAFLADGFSVYYVVAGSQSDNSGNDTFNILRGVSVQLTNVTSNNYTVTYPDGVTAETSGVTITRNNNTLNFAATSSAALGTYTVSIGSNRTATINILAPADMFALEGIENDVYFTVVSDSTEIPNEPMSGGNYSWNYIKKSGSNYTFTQSAWGTNGRYQDSPDGFLNLDVIGASPALKQNLQGQNVVGVIDRGWGADTRPCINLTDAEWHNILVQFVSNKTVYISNGAGGQTRLTSAMVNETLEDGSYRYKMYPYVVKLIIDGGSYQDGWHVDCAIVDTKIYSVSYDYNLPSSAIIQETSDLLKPETKFYTPGTTGVGVGVMTLGSSTQVTGNTSITIYDTNTLSTSEYKFLYWNTEPDGSGTSYDPNDKLPAINSNVTLYAIWNHTQTSGTVKIQKYEVFQDPNDIRQDDGTSYSFTITIANAEADTKYPYTIYNANGSEKTTDLELASGDTISLAHGEYIIVNNVPGGNVTVTETVAEDAKYTASWTVNGTASKNPATGTVSAGNQTVMVCTNTYAPLTTQVTVSKTVTGNMGDINKDFEFTVTSDKAVTVTENLNGYSVSEGGKIITFNLKDNESVTIAGVPISANLTVTEKSEPYTVTITVGETTYGNGDSIPVTNATSISVNNHYDVSIDTGVNLNSFPFIMMLSSCIVMAVFFLIGKKRMMF